MPWIKANRYSKAGYRKLDSDGESCAGHAKGKRKGFDANGGVSCKGCFEMKNENAILKEEIIRLKTALATAQKTTKKDVDNAHTPSSARRFKKKATEENLSKIGGAMLGHKGHGRSSLSSAEIESDQGRLVKLESYSACPDCGGELEKRGDVNRTIVDIESMKAKRLLYVTDQKSCRACKKSYTRKPPVLPKSLYGNGLLAHALTLHYVHGTPIGKIINILGPEVTLGGLMNAFHRVGRICHQAMPKLILDFRLSPVRHADETGWRTDGESGYAWLFATPVLSIFEFADTRASRIPKRILGDEKLAGVLVVDRYGGYNKMQVALQYCFAHLMREVKKLSDEFSTESSEVESFVSELIPEMALAQKLRSQDISDGEFYLRAAQAKEKIRSLMQKEFKHLGIRRIQEIFVAKEHRLYHWATDRAIPADNNRAERELRPTVVSRKVSFGSQ